MDGQRYASSAALARWSGYALIALGVSVLVGWAGNIGPLMTVLPGRISMKPNAAMGFLLAGLALVLLTQITNARRGRIASAIAAGFMIVIGLLTLIEYVLHRNLFIDQLLFRDLAQRPYPGRMAQIAALNFCLTGVSLFLLSISEKQAKWPQLLSLVSGFSAALAIIGHLYSVPVPYGSDRYTSMALHTGMGFLILSCAILHCRPTLGVMQVISSQHAGGWFARRLLPIAVTVPALLAAVYVHSKFSHWDVRLALASLIVLLMVLSAALVWTLAFLLNRLEAEKIAAQTALQHSEELLEQRYRTMFEEAIVGIFQTTPQGRFLRLNPAMARMFGYSSPADMAASVTNIADQLYVDPLRRNELKSLIEQHGAVENFECQVYRKDGTKMWISENVRAVYEGSVVVLYEGTNSDITARKQTETALRQSEQRLSEAAEFTQTVIASSPVGIGTYDGVSGQCMSVNEALARIIGCTTEVALKQNFRQLTSWKESGLLKNADDVLSDGKACRHETRFVTTFGKEVCLDYTLVPFSVRKRPHLLLMVSDVMEQKQLEEQFRQAQKMEAVGRLAGGVAHDFNNAIGVIVGYGALLKERVLADEKALQYVAEISKASQRAASLTRQLLAFSRKQLIQPIVLDLNAVVKDTERMLRRLIGEDITLAVALGPDLGRIQADRGQLEQVLMNLAVNARDAMPQGGKLIIETHNAALDKAAMAQHPYVKPGHYVVLSVSDTGCGMDKETQAHIFEPFFTTKGLGKGTGLGLSTVYGIVKQSEGYIWVYSEPGKGARFNIYWPRTAKAGQPLETSPELSELPGGSETILLVEDDDSMRELTRNCLAAMGYTVLIAPDGEAAIRVASQHDRLIHLLLTDVVMPGFSGRQLAESLARYRPGMKVLFMSGYTADLIADHGVLNLHVTLLEKPFTQQSLLNKVRLVLDGGLPAQTAVAGR